MDRQTDRQTDEPTDRPTDGLAYRVACTRLKTFATMLYASKLEYSVLWEYLHIAVERELVVIAVLLEKQNPNKNNIE